MMKLRIWFASLIGVGLWAILLGLLFSFSHMRQEGVYYVFIFLFLTFVFAAIGLIRSRANKFISGLAFLWAIWSQLALVPIVVGLLREIYRDKSYEHMAYMNEVDQSMYWDDVHPIYVWIDQHSEAIFTGNVGLFLILLILIYIPLARKWQANPEE